MNDEQVVGLMAAILFAGRMKSPDVLIHSDGLAEDAWDLWRAVQAKRPEAVKTEHPGIAEVQKLQDTMRAIYGKRA